MKRSIPALILALALLFAVFSAGAEDDYTDDWISFDDGTEFEDFEVFTDITDDGGVSGQLYEQQAQNISAVSGYDNPDLKYDGDYAFYLSEDGSYCITTLYLGTEADVVVPATLGGYPVKVIGDHTFENKGFVESVEVPSGVVSIGKQAFFMCINLKIVILPEGVINVGDQCFAACYLLNYVQLPDSLESVGEMAFLGCYALKEIEFGTNLKSIGSCAFHTCRELKRVTVPSDDVSIDATAFLQCPENMEIIYSNRS